MSNMMNTAMVISAIAIITMTIVSAIFMLLVITMMTISAFYRSKHACMKQGAMIQPMLNSSC